MSKTIDEKVIAMQFDNRNFEKNVQTTMSTLEKLKKSLNLSGASKGLEDIGKAAKSVDMNGLSAGIETARMKFSALQVMGVTALANITNSAINASKRITSALTIDPIKSGFQEYETQINAIQTILANTESKGTTLKDVNDALDELNHYADMTIYNFTEMTRNIGTFTAAGIDLKTSTQAIKGIANLAAVSGSTSQQASTAMYQLSQALASGTVKLQDWNSVVNAGMGGQVFQDALKETARVHNVNIDAMIKKEGSFRETLQKGWLTADILTETLNKFTGDMSAEELKKIGYTEDQIKAIIKMGQTASDAATKVKTFTQLWDTLKEAAQSGWTQSWELIVGDFEESKELLTNISDVISNMINKSAEARNNLLQGWKDLGGRKDLIASFSNIFEAVSSVIKPVIEAFREIFPPTTAKQLHGFTAGLKELTAKLIISEKTAKNIKATFKGLFSILGFVADAMKIVVTGALSLIGAFDGIQDGALGITAAIGNFITNIRSSIKEANLFGMVIEKIGKFFKNLISTIINAMSNPEFFSVVNGGIFAAILLGIRNFVNGFSNPLDKLTDLFSNAGDVLENVTGIFDSVRECFVSYQNQLKANVLMKIAGAIGILAASLYVISTIDPGRLVMSLGGLAVLMKELMWSLTAFNTSGSKIVNIGKAVIAMIGMSSAILILSSALKNISSIDISGIIKGLIGIGGLMFELSVFLEKANLNGKMTGTAFGIGVLSTAILILSKSMEKFGSMSWENISKGLLAIGSLFMELAIFTKMTNNTKGLISTSSGIAILGAAMNIFAVSIKKFGSMSWNSIGKGLSAMAGAFAEVAIAIRLMPKNMISIGTGLTIVSSAMAILSNAVNSFGSMSWMDIGKGLTVMGGSLLELSVGLKMMSGSISGSTALIIAASALTILVPVMKAFGGMPWESIVKGLVTLGGAFTVIGVAGALLKPLIPALLGLSGAFVLLGIGMAGVGIGLTGIATGIATLSTAVSGGVTGIVTGITNIIMATAKLIPMILQQFGEGIVAFSQIIGNHAPELASSLLKLFSECLKSMTKYIPQMANSILDLFIGVLESLRDHMPKLVTVTMQIIGQLFKAIGDELSKVDSESLMNAIKSLGLLTALIYGLSTISGMIPGAMIGVVGMGVIIGELALVLAALGGLAQITGLQWLISEGGNFLQSIGTAIGQLLGGLVGGTLKGATSTLPKVGESMSDFMKNIQPFIDGAMLIDSTIVDGVSSLMKAILLVTATNVLQSLSSWLTGSNSLKKFGDELVPFGESMNKYAESVSGIDTKSIAASASAAKALSEVASNLPKKGGILDWFTGNSDFSSFGKQLESFGKSMSAYSKSISDIDPKVIIASANAAKSLSELAKGLPNTGGIFSWFTGNNDISTFGDQLKIFGKGLKSYSKSIVGIEPDTIIASATAAKSLSELANGLPKTGGIFSWFTGDNAISTFGKQLKPFGEGMKSYSESINGINPDTVSASATAAKSLSELANNLPNLGGLLAFFAGDQSLKTFGEHLVPFGKSLNKYSDSISGISPDAITASATAAETLAKLNNVLEPMGGVISWFSGDRDLGKFGSQLQQFGKGIKAYSNELGENGINDGAVKASATATMALAELYNALDPIGGVIEFFKGKKDFEGFGIAIESFGGSIKKYAESLGDNVKSETINIFNNVIKAFAELNGSLPSIGGIVKFFSGEQNLEIFGNQIKNFGTSISEYISSIVDIKKEDISKVDIATNAGIALAKLQGSLEPMGGVISWFSGDRDLETFGSQLIKFGEGITKYINSIGTISEDGIKNIDSATNAGIALAKLQSSLEPLGGVVGWFNGEQDLEKFGTQLVSFGRSLTLYSNSIKDIKPEQITASAEAAKALSELAGKLPDKETWMSKSMSMSSFGTIIVPFGKSLALYSQNVKDVAGDKIRESAEATQALVSVVKTMNGIDTKGVTGFKTAIDELAKVNVSGFASAFKGKSADISKIGNDLVSTLNKGMTDKKATMAATASSLIKTMIEALDNKKTQFKAAGNELALELNSGLTENISKIKDALTKVIDNAISGIRGYYDKFHSAGSYLVSGFANGISANTYKAAAQARAMASAADTAARKELDEHSPSKEGYEIGDYFGIGFINGIAKNIKNAYNISSDMAGNAESGLTNALSRVNDILNSDMDSQPTIKPVLDLSDIQSGARSINGLFGMSPSVGVVSNIKAINSAMNQRNQNGSMDEVISAINGLKKTISKSSGDSYTIGDITYSNGTEVADAIQTLVRAAKMERRT